MDTPIKLTKKFYRFEKDKRIYEAYDDFFLKLNPDEPQFNIEETDNVALVFDFPSSLYKIEIENVETGELDEVRSGIEFDLNMWSEEKTFYPGFFDLFITKGQDRKRYFFCVHPKTMELDNVMHLRSYVNSYYDGLSLDLEKKRKMSVSFDEQKSSSSDFTSYNFLTANYPSVMNYMNRYVKGMNDQLIKKEVVSSKITKISPKSVKWLVQKGYTRNSDISKPSVLLTKKTSFTLDNEQNRVFKSYVVYWDNELSGLLTRMSDYQRQVSERIEQLKRQLEDLREDEAKMAPIKTIPEFVKNQTRGKIKDTEAQIKSIGDLLNDYKERYDRINHYEIFTENIRFNTWISSINEEPNFGHKKIYSKELLLIKETRDRYIGAKRRTVSGKGQKVNYFAEKSTPKLFETYLYVMLIDILNSSGFSIKDDNLYGNDLMFSLSSRSNIVMENNDGMTCEIIYDKQLDDAQKEFVESDYCTINSSHNRPDFILSYKDQYGNLVDSIVIEAKWRRLENIYNENGDTDVMINLKDYTNLGYFNVTKGAPERGVISKVIAIYPDKNERNVSLLGGLINYSGINVSDSVQKTANYLYIRDLIQFKDVFNI